jgi:hypothetical protein
MKAPYGVLTDGPGSNHSGLVETKKLRSLISTRKHSATDAS